MKNSTPFVSVVVICYNGEATLGNALDSLLAQTYPKDRYEVIVVDDGSADNSAAVAARYPSVRYIRLAQNQGVSGARNAGLRAAKGTIYAAFDCDCKARTDWLEELVKGYADGKAIGVGSAIVEPEPIKGLATQYVSSCDSMFVPVQDKHARRRKLPHQRLLGYIKARLVSAAPSDKPREVPELYGASGSFLREVLLTVNGWDVAMSGIEDRDISQRIHKAFPGKPFYLMPTAKIIHERGETLRQYLRRPFRRGPVTFEFHRQNNILPPIFPFPLLCLLACLAGLIRSPLTALFVVVVVPQLLYIWWPYKSLQRRRVLLLMFPYIQLAEETMVLVGLARGYLKFRQKRRAHA